MVQPGMNLWEGINVPEQHDETPLFPFRTKTLKKLDKARNFSAGNKMQQQ